MALSQRVHPVADRGGRGTGTANVHDGDAAFFHDMQQPIAAMRLVFSALENRSGTALDDRRLIELAASQAEALQAMLDDRLGRRPAPAATTERDAPSKPHLGDPGSSEVWCSNRGGASLDHVVRSVIDPMRAVGPSRLVYYVTARPLVSIPLLVLRRTVANVVMNAVEATEPGGVVEIVLRTAGTTAVLTVDDSGGGFGRKSVGRGLGVVTSMAAVLGAGGEIAYLHSPLGGVRVRIEFPTVGP